MALVESGFEIEQGEKCPEFELEDYEGETVKLSDLDNYDGVLVIFMCNHCPFVKANLGELKRLVDRFDSIAFVGINPNADTHPQDSVGKMSEIVQDYGLKSENFYYLVDETQEIAEMYGAKCTPDPFLLNMRHELYYHGRLSDKLGPDQELENHEMEGIIESMLKSRDPPEERNPSQGCSIKWKE